MKNILQILILLSISICFSQTKEQREKIDQFQVEWMNKAEEKIRENQLDQAFIAYGFVKNIYSLTIEIN